MDTINRAKEKDREGCVDLNERGRRNGVEGASRIVCIPVMELAKKLFANCGLVCSLTA